MKPRLSHHITSSKLFPSLIALLILILPLSLFAQSGAKWATGGNAVSPGDFLGTTNNQPLLFRTNGLQQMQLATTGVLQVNTLSGTGNGLVTTDPSGNLVRTPYPGSSTEFLGGDGLFHSISSTTGWVTSGNNVIVLPVMWE